MAKHNKLIDQSALSSPPALLFEIINSLDSELSNEKIGNIVGRDQSVSAQILRLSNSSFFGFAGNIKSLGQAINILGTKTVRNITVTSLLFSHTRKIRLHGMDIISFWLQSFLVADITRGIAKLSKLDSDEAYIAGLLKDIAKLVLYARKIDDTTLLNSNHNIMQIYNFEKEQWGIDSAELGGEMLQEWNLPSGIIAAVSCQNNENLINNNKYGIASHIACEIASLITDHHFKSSLTEERLHHLIECLELEPKEFYEFLVNIPDIVVRGRMVMSVLDPKAGQGSRKNNTHLTLVCEEENNMSKMLFRLYGCTVDVVKPDDIYKYQTYKEKQKELAESAKENGDENHLKEETVPEVKDKKCGLLKRIFSRKKKVVVEIAPVEVAPEPIKWQRVVVIDTKQEIVVDREISRICKVDRQAVEKQEVDHFPFVFSKDQILF